MYKSLREHWNQALSKSENFENIDETTKLKLVLNDHITVKATAQFIVDAFNMRRQMLILSYN